MGLRFTWDPHKAVANFRKHGVSFYEAVTAFAEFAKRVATRWGNQVDWWITINEPGVQSSVGYLVGLWPISMIDSEADCLKETSGRS